MVRMEFIGIFDLRIAICDRFGNFRISICDLRSRGRLRDRDLVHVHWRNFGRPARRDRKSQFENRKSNSNRLKFQQRYLRRTLIADRENDCADASRDVDLRVLSSMQTATQFSSRQ